MATEEFGAGEIREIRGGAVPVRARRRGYEMKKARCAVALSPEVSIAHHILWHTETRLMPPSVRPECIDQENRRTQVGLRLQRHIGIEEGSSQVVSSDTHGKGRNDLVLHSTAASPSELIRVTQNHLTVALEVDAGLTRATEKQFAVHGQLPPAHGVEHRSGHVGHQIGATSGVKRIEGARIAKVRLYREAAVDVRAKNRLEAVHAHLPYRRRVCLRVRKTNTTFLRGSKSPRDGFLAVS